jgi:hypothetical protein
MTRVSNPRAATPKTHSDVWQRRPAGVSVVVPLPVCMRPAMGADADLWLREIWIRNIKPFDPQVLLNSPHPTSHLSVS